MAISAARRKASVESNRRHPKDVGSPEVQIGLLTEEIHALSDHLRGHAKDNHGRRGLQLMVSQRNRLLKYLARMDEDGYHKLIGRLGLRK
jgi:small subunit ribosomal protein S15